MLSVESRRVGKLTKAQFGGIKHVLLISNSTLTL
jgi:hypothetical protein